MSQINESAIKSPGVYVTEIPSFPPSIAQVATAIPVFVGYTEFATLNGQDVHNQAIEINSLVQYTTYFGGAPDDLAVSVTLDTSLNPISVVITPPYQMYNAIQLFFAHGGGTCYILSVGGYQTASPYGKQIDFLPTTKPTVYDIIQKVDEITLLVVPDAVVLGPFEFNNVMTAALQLCANLQDRFTILDVYNGYKDRDYTSSDVITVFRTGVGGSNLNYGAAYYPWLNTSLPVTFSFPNIALYKAATPPATTPTLLSTFVTGNVAINQITNASADQNKIVTPFLTAPTFYSGSFAFAVNSPYWVSATVGQPIATAYGQIPTVGTTADIMLRLEFMYMVLGHFVALSTWTDVPSAYSGVPAGSTLQEIFNSFIQPGTATILSTIETIMSQMLLIDESFPNPIPPAANPAVAVALGQVTLAKFQPIAPTTVHYLAIGSPTTDPTIYSMPPGSTLTANQPQTVAQAVTTVLPYVQSVFNTLMNFLNSFANAVANRVNSLELQVIATSTVYANIKNAITNAGVLVPPSGAIAGIYASVDASRGVWKAPANVAVQYVIEPTVDIDSAFQEDLNIDTNAGKSINAIRTFTGVGTLVWGARTLDGNSNDWRYIPVRRLFIVVEASIKKASFSFVFEPNDARTWAKVRAMIENYLTLLWRQGALAGAKPEVAFYVKVGLGQTMTFDDILNGRMIIEIGMAPVRPAEFIILRFTQIQQQS